MTESLSALVTAALAGVEPRAVWRKLLPRLVPTQLLRVPALDRQLGCQVTLASELGQRTGSFKYRAALAFASESPAPRLLTASSGNFGAALAAAAQTFGKGCTVVMPARSPAVKIAAVRSFGATVDLIDTDRVPREVRLGELAAADPDAQVVSPYDHPLVIVGNGSLGVEILARHNPVAMVAPVGGGGLTSGLCLAAALDGRGCQVVGAEPLLANDAAQSLRRGELVRSDREADTLCDGARTRALGKANFVILRALLAGIIEVPEEAVVAALRLLALHAQLRVEPTGALALAALLVEAQRFRGQQVVCVVSGGNVDPAVYQSLVPAERRA